MDIRKPKSQKWTSRRNPDIERELRVHLAGVMKFANLGVSQLGSSRLEEHLESHPDSIRDFVGFLRASDSTWWEKWISNFNIKDAAVMHTHLCKRIDDIIVKTGLLPSVTVWRLSGAMELTTEPLKDRFGHYFSIRWTKSSSIHSRLKKVIDLRISELIRDLDLKPTRFRRCERCRSYFYQPTAKDRNFCSLRCAGTVRQARFLKKRRGNHQENSD
jgi:hypothetical protein